MRVFLGVSIWHVVHVIVKVAIKLIDVRYEAEQKRWNLSVHLLCETITFDTYLLLKVSKVHPFQVKSPRKFNFPNRVCFYL